MRSTSRLRVLLSLCVIGSVLGAIGAAFISSGSNECEVLLVPNASSETDQIALGKLLHISNSAHEQIQCVIWSEKAIRVEDASQLLMLKNLRVLDLSQCTDLCDEAAAELEGLEHAECLMLPKSTSARAFKRWRIELPEALRDEGRKQVIINPLLAIRQTGRSIA